MAGVVQKIKDKTAVVGIVGLGYVGLPLAVLFAEAGFAVCGFETDERRKTALRAGTSYVTDLPSERISPLTAVSTLSKGHLYLPDSFSEIAECDAVVICVPTPLAKSKDPDLSFIVDAAKLIRQAMRRGQLVVLESTTYPGTTRELVLPILSGAEDGVKFDHSVRREQFKVGQDFFLAFSPERVDPGNPRFTIKNTPKIVGGITPLCAEAAVTLYNSIIDRVEHVSSTDAAEMTKLLENTFRMINIGLVNEFSIMCRRLGVDVWEVIDAAATKPFGFIPFYPGPGLGGHCIPVDPLYLSWKLRLSDYRARFIELASEVNGHMPVLVVERVSEALNFARKAVNGSKVAVLGVAYKKDIDDVRESPALDILSLLQKKGAKISYFDPFVKELRLPDGQSLASCEFSSDWLSQQDCVVIVTDHSRLDFPAIVESSPLLVDTRNVVARKGLAGTAGDRLFKL